jgi:hypothetical protein
MLITRFDDARATGIAIVPGGMRGNRSSRNNAPRRNLATNAHAGCVCFE